MASQHIINNVNEQRLLSRLRNVTWKGESQLPLPPQSVIDFSAKARQPDVTVRELSDVVECEPALTAELLRNVNSCLRGLRNKVDSVPQAIALLGIPNSTTILLSSALSNAVQQMESPLIATADFRRETVERALFAREVARALRLNDTIAYTAAMLQDVLLPVLTRRHQVDYHEYLHQGGNESIDQFERKRFDWTHAEVTAKTLLDWGFSNNLALAVLQHHDAPEEMIVAGEDIPPGFPCSCSALLMDVMRQSPNGINRLLALQAALPNLQIMEIVGAVDRAIEELNPNLHNPVSLVHRIQHAMLSQLEGRRQQIAVVGQQFGNYVLEEQIKESTMGAIYKARHVHLRRPAAVKVLRADRTNRSTIAQFEAEVQLTSQLRHPNTVSIFDYGRTPDDLFYYAMELIDGMTLSDLVRFHGRLPDGRVLQILQQVCGSLTEAHGMNLIHRDIKPENVMISVRANRPDHATLLDFGLVATLSQDESDITGNSRGIVGTPLYISPEAAQGCERITPQSDLYSLAAIGYFLLTGTPVFRGNTVADVLQQHMHWTAVLPSERAEIHVAPELEQILMWCLQKDPGDRPASAEKLADYLSKVVPVQPWGTNDAWAWWHGHRLHVTGGSPNDSFDQSISATESNHRDAAVQRSVEETMSI
ncbi:MAG TPA: HDOD domain-containing protein [Planctomicrobium sp.]|nr:HDOD domain-containing protein [Planctomicrobium sp.]